MSAKGGVPDAWDDDWTEAADTNIQQQHQQQQHQHPQRQQPAPQQDTAPRLTKAEKRAQHQQIQKELWDSAENPSRNLWLETQGAVPLKQEFKPAMKVLSRKPGPSIAKRATADGVANASLHDDEDSEEESKRKRESEFEERQRRAKLEREEKVRKYAEARERIMGASGPGSPKSKPESRDSSQGRGDGRRPRGRGASSLNGQPTSAGQSPARPMPSTSNGLVFDPEDMTRRLPRKDVTASPDSVVQPKDGEPLRQPRGPENSGRGGFGFPGRGGRPGA